MDHATINMLSSRLDLLERQCRRWRLSAFVVASVGTVVLLAGARQGERDGKPQVDKFTVRELEAERIVLKNAEGEQWFSLFESNGVPQMAIDGPSEDAKRSVHHVQLIVNRGGVPYMSFYSGTGGRVFFGVDPRGEGHLSLSGKSGTILMRMGEEIIPGMPGGDSGPPRMRFLDQTGRTRMRLGLKPDGSGGIEVLQQPLAKSIQEPLDDSNKGSAAGGRVKTGTSGKGDGANY